ncbi:MAG: IgGFc-binding protein [Myxococcota bacterium]
MRRTARWSSVLVACVVATAAAGACQATGDDDDDAGDDDAGAVGGAGPGSGTTTSGIGGSLVGSVVGSGGSCPTSCSTDLKQVIDCDGALVETCGSDLACLGGSCTNDPCAAAEAQEATLGCDFWALKPDTISAVQGACFAVFVANTWDAPTQVDLYRGDTLIPHSGFVRIPQGQGASLTYGPYDPALGLPPGEVAIVFISQGAFGSITCPITPADTSDPWTYGTGRGQAFNVRTDRPVVAYSILPFGGGSAAATSASLLLPTNVWGENYIGVNAYAKSVVVAQAQPSLNVLAIEDDTSVTLLPSVSVVGGGGLPGGPANAPLTYTLARGEYLQLTQDQELTGSPIQADKPVGVWGGASCLSVPVSAVACDSAHQQIPPVKALGFRYVGVRYRNRASASTEEAPPWRLVGAVDGTQLSWTPAPPPGAPTTLALGEVVEFSAPGPFVVESQDEDHPYYMAQYMTGLSHINSSTNEGDPEWVNVLPADQYLDRYVFFTDPTYSETSLVVVRARDSSGMFRDVDLDCAGPLQGWTPLGDYEFTRLDLVTGNFENVGNCSNGRHEIESDGPFGVTVWGWGSSVASPSTSAVSYGYPAGASVRSINAVEVPPIPR